MEILGAQVKVHPNQASNPDNTTIGGPVYCENDTLDHVATEAGFTLITDREGCEERQQETCTPDRDSNLNLPVNNSLVYCESSALDHAANEVTSTTMENHPVPLEEPWGGVQVGERSTPIQEFYRDRSVFMTGASGFCGKILLSKLLRSCPHIGNIFILIRPKKNKDITQRLAALLSEPIKVLVDLVESKKHQDALKKIVLVLGDISQPDMGISPEDRERLRREVSVVFHLAATLKFDENLKLALKTNVGGTQAVIELCKDMRHLKCPWQEIEERVYPPTTDVEELTKKLDPMSLEDVSKIETTIIGEWPNTYTFTKALAEHVIDRYSHELPVAIFRPSMVISVWREPVPGWIDSLNGPTLPVLGGILGKMRCGHVDVTKLADIVPVDMVVNSLIATAWDVASAPDRNGAKVYAFTSGSRNQLTWKELVKNLTDSVHMLPSVNCMYYHVVVLTKHLLLYRLFSILFELVPACFADVVPYIRTGKHKNVDLYWKATKFHGIVAYFSNREWKFHDANMGALLDKISPEDRDVFYFDVRSIVWKDYLYEYVKGVRTYLVKEPLDTLPQARKNYQWSLSTPQLYIFCYSRPINPLVESVLISLLRLCGHRGRDVVLQTEALHHALGVDVSGDVPVLQTDFESHIQIVPIP
uniref:Fatty acyl-CoA reductase n=1 Tax=Timema genevievae TaxID=629358 RepID=A0A7R9JT38_TIMGE|nr:unnamed protein product [Timema genevievae]